MSSLSIDDITNLVAQKKKSFRLRLCIMESKVVVMTSSKAYYNHKRKCRSCKGVHETLSKANLGEGLAKLRVLAPFNEDVCVRRKQRNDLHQRHNYPKGKKAAAPIPIKEEQKEPAMGETLSLQMEPLEAQPIMSLELLDPAPWPQTDLCRPLEESFAIDPLQEEDRSWQWEAEEILPSTDGSYPSS